MTIQIGARDARQRFSELLGRVGYGGEEVIIERSGKPMVAVIPIEVYRQLIAEREGRSDAVARIQKKQPKVSPAKVERDVADTVKSVRAQRAARGR